MEQAVKSIEKRSIQGGEPRGLERVPVRGGRSPVAAAFGLWICHHGVGRVSRAAVDLVRPVARVFDFFGLSHLYAGEGVHWSAATGWQPVRPGDVVLSVPGVPHVYGAAPGAAWHEDCIGFVGARAEALLSHGFVKADAPLLRQALPVRRVRTIAARAASQAYESQLRASALLEQLLVDLHLIQRRSARGELGYGTALDNLVQAIEERPAEDWRVPEMAASVNLSPSQFRRVFRRKVHMGPKEFCERTRLELAARHLAESELAVAEVARRVGYEDPFHFSSRFRHRYGVSPRQYRQGLAPLK